MYDITNTKTGETFHSDKIGVEPCFGGVLTFRIPAEGWPDCFLSSEPIPLADVELGWTNEQFGMTPGTL